MLKDCMCKSCGITFSGGPRAWYCPNCRWERQKIADIKCAERRRLGKTRKIGSTDLCVICGNSYTVKGGRQKYCEKCAPKAIAEIDKEQGLSYYHENKETINPLRNKKRRKPVRTCAVCGKELLLSSRSLTCSNECKRNYLKSYIAKRDL